MHRENRKLLVSVFNAQEAREAVLGGARIVDSEDPKSALGNIKPRNIMDVSDTVLDFKRNFEVQLSTNIGEDQLLFRRSQDGKAIEKTPYEIAGKASQAAIGVACSMGTRVHPVSYVKVGVDGMGVDMVGDVLEEVVLTLRRTEQFSHCQVMSVLFAQNLSLWAERRKLDPVRKVLVELREFNPTSASDTDAFDLQDYAVNTLRDRTGQYMFTDRSQVSLAALVQRGVLPAGSDSSLIRTSDLFDQRRYFAQIASEARRTDRAIIKAMVDVTADAGANGIMLDTSILSKVSNICLVDTDSDRQNTGGETMIDINRLMSTNEIPLRGILPLDDIEFFVNYCHHRGIFANVAGSIESFQAQQLWALLPELDQASTRGNASAVERDPATLQETPDTRQHRIIKRSLVRGIAPPEHGGVLNLPAQLKQQKDARDTVRALIELIAEKRAKLGMAKLEAFYVNKFGDQEAIS